MSSRARRRACLKATGSELHVYNRGVNQGTIFFKEEDYLSFIDIMLHALEGSGVAILLFTLMPNHFHLVVTQTDPYYISAFMKRVTEKQAKRINCLKHRTGHLFQSRYKISRVPNPGAFLELSHYIHFNPVVAKLAKKPLDWPYSSIKDYSGTKTSGLVTVEPLLTLIGGRDRYTQFLKDYDPHGSGSVWKYLLRTS